MLKSYCAALLTASKKIEHAGYQRYIINRIPKRYDEYGDELEDDEEDERADAEAAEENPYNEVRLDGTIFLIDCRSHIRLLTVHRSRTVYALDRCFGTSQPPFLFSSIQVKSPHQHGTADL